MLFGKRWVTPKWQREVMDFLAGKQQRTAGKAQVLSIVDVFVETAAEAGSLSQTLQQVIKGKAAENTRASFQYQYDHVEKKARFLLQGSPQYINRMLEVLE